MKRGIVSKFSGFRPGGVAYRSKQNENGKIWPSLLLWHNGGQPTSNSTFHSFELANQRNKTY